MRLDHAIELAAGVAPPADHHEHRAILRSQRHDRPLDLSARQLAELGVFLLEPREAAIEKGVGAGLQERIEGREDPQSQMRGGVAQPEIDHLLGDIVDEVRRLARVVGRFRPQMQRRGAGAVEIRLRD